MTDTFTTHDGTRLVGPRHLMRDGHEIIERMITDIIRLARDKLLFGDLLALGWTVDQINTHATTAVNLRILRMEAKR